MYKMERKTLEKTTYNFSKKQVMLKTQNIQQTWFIKDELKSSNKKHMVSSSKK